MTDNINIHEHEMLLIKQMTLYNSWVQPYVKGFDELSLRLSW